MTFLLTDIEGSTRVLARVGARYPEMVARHRAVIVDAAERHGGRQRRWRVTRVSRVPTAAAAVLAAVEAQRRLAVASAAGEAVLE